MQVNQTFSKVKKFSILLFLFGITGIQTLNSSDMYFFGKTLCPYLVTSQESVSAGTHIKNIDDADPDSNKETPPQGMKKQRGHKTQRRERAGSIETQRHVNRLRTTNHKYTGIKTKQHYILLSVDAFKKIYIQNLLRELKIKPENTALLVYLSDEDLKQGGLSRSRITQIQQELGLSRIARVKEKRQIQKLATRKGNNIFCVSSSVGSNHIAGFSSQTAEYEKFTSALFTSPGIRIKKVSPNTHLRFDQIDLLPYGCEVISGGTGFLSQYLNKAIMRQQQEKKAEQRPLVILTRETEHQNLLAKIPQTGCYVVTMPSIEDLVSSSKFLALFEKLIQKTDVFYHTAGQTNIPGAYSFSKQDKTIESFFKDKERVLKDMFLANVFYTAIAVHYTKLYNKKFIYASTALSYASDKASDRYVNEGNTVPFLTKTNSAEFIGDSADEVLNTFAKNISTHSMDSLYKKLSFEALKYIDVPQQMDIMQKLIGEALVQTLPQEKAVICRITNMYDDKRPLQSSIIRMALEGAFLKTPQGFNEATRNWVHVEDVAQAMFYAGRNKIPKDNVFILASSNAPYSIVQLVKDVLKILGLNWKNHTSFYVDKNQINRDNTKPSPVSFVPSFNTGKSMKWLKFNSRRFSQKHIEQLTFVELNNLALGIFEKFMERGIPRSSFFKHFPLYEALLEGELFQPYGYEIQVVQNVCNLNCKHCVKYIKDHSEASKKIMDADDLITIINKIIELAENTQEFAKTRGLIRINFSGFNGEPTLCPGLVYGLKRISKNAHVVEGGLFTNGIKVDKDLIDVLTDEGIVYTHFSIDAATPETFAKLKGTEANRELRIAQFKQIQHNFKELIKQKIRKESSLEIMAGYVIGKENYEETIDFANMIRRLRFEAISELREEYQRAGKPFPVKIDPITIRYKIDLLSGVKHERKIEEAVVNEIFDHYLKTVEQTYPQGCGELNIVISHKKQDVLNMEKAGKSCSRVCIISRMFGTINASGELIACDHASINSDRLGRLLIQDLRDIMLSPNYSQFLSDLNPGENPACKICPPSAKQLNEFADFFMLCKKLGIKFNGDPIMEFLKIYHKHHSQRISSQKPTGMHPYLKAGIESQERIESQA